MQNSYRDNRDIELHYRDIRIFIIAQPYIIMVMKAGEHTKLLVSPLQMYIKICPTKLNSLGSGSENDLRRPLF